MEAKKPTTRAMSDRHEQYINNILGGRRTRNSGAVWSDPTDVRMDVREDRLAFAADGKSTLGQSITLKREDWDKLKDQAGDLTPIMPIRFYDTYRLDVGLDLWLMDDNTFVDMFETYVMYEDLKW